MIDDVHRQSHSNLNTLLAFVCLNTYGITLSELRFILKARLCMLLYNSQRTVKNVESCRQNTESFSEDDLLFCECTVNISIYVILVSTLLEQR